MSSATAIATLMKPVGPKAEGFVNDKRMITGIMGPVGSAKTTSCIRKMLMSALWQRPGPDGIYRVKWGVIRDTYPQLKKTVLASWFAWFPKRKGQWNGEAPFEHTVKIDVHVGATVKRIELTVIFAAMGENKAEDVMRGWEVTGIWLNEGDLVASEVFAYAMTRIGRYPSMAMGGCAWRGLMIDMNAPDVDNWTYEILVDQDLGLDKALEEELRLELGEQFGIGFYVQPGGRSVDPPPENIQNLPAGYYAQQIMALSKRPWLIRRMVDNEFGAVRHGQVVYPEYNDNLHCARERLKPIAGVPIRLATDQDLTAAAVFMQRDHRGQIRILREVVNFAANDDDELEQIGAYAFGQKVARSFLDNFPNNELAEISWADPAASAGENATGADKSWRQKFQDGLRDGMGNKQLKVRPAPCPGNRLEQRLDAVRKPMARLVESGERAEAGFLICPVGCPTLRRGLKGMYVYRRTKLQGGHGRFDAVPLKNDFANVQDAVQYGCVGISRSGNGDALGLGHPGKKPGKARRTVKNDGAYRVFG